METLVALYPSHSSGPTALSWPADMLASHNPSSSSSRPASSLDRSDNPPAGAAGASSSAQHQQPPHAPPPHHQPAPDADDSYRRPSIVSSGDGDDLSADESASEPSPLRIRVKSLQHIQSFCNEDLERMACSQSPSFSSLDAASDQLPQYEISDMPVTDVIEMVAGLLTKITSTNDRQHEQIHSQIPSGENGLSPHAASVLSFHGKNIPSITILSYLSRIHKYCPATYEVFLSLLVYFDRMTDKVNAGPMRNLRKAHEEHLRREASNSTSQQPSPDLEPQSQPQSQSQSQSAAEARSSDPTTTPPSSVPPSASSLAQPTQSQPQPTPPSPPLSESEPYSLSEFFVVDSYNIHRLVIAGVTCASKFFSDVFYTNSRYAKVGGLPLPELNHLELQFLTLNDFRLSIPVEELEAYATMLVAFYAREIVSQRKEGAMEDVQASPIIHAKTAP